LARRGRSAPSQFSSQSVWVPRVPGVAYIALTSNSAIPGSTTYAESRSLGAEGRRFKSCHPDHENGVRRARGSRSPQRRPPPPPPVARSTADNPLIRQATRIRYTMDGASPTSAANPTGPTRCPQRRPTTLRTTGADVARGERRGHEDPIDHARFAPGAIPTGPAFAVGQNNLNRSAARATGQSCSTTSWARHSRARGVRAALACTVRTSCGRGWMPSDSSTPLQVVLTYQDPSVRVVTRPQPTSPISTRL
jgi:hypothetical protein